MQERKNFRCRMALYALLVLVCFLLQFSRGTRLTLWGSSPDVLPFLFAAVALFEGPYVGAIFGFTGGILLSVNSTASEALLSMYYSLGCLGAGFFASRYMRRVFPTLLMCGIFLSLFKHRDRRRQTSDHKTRTQFYAIRSARLRLNRRSYTVGTYFK